MMSLDDSGKVVAHTDENQTGHNYRIETDTFGHDVGDKVLIAISDCLAKTFQVFLCNHAMNL